MIRLSLGFPSHADEVTLLKRKQSVNLLDLVEPVLDSRGLETLRADVDSVHVHPDIYNYIVTLVGATRNHRDVLSGASPRASIALTAMAKALAYLQGRDYVVPKDISPIFNITLAHRLLLRPGAENDGITGESVLGGIMKVVRAPQAG